MKFWEAMKALEEGKKVRMLSWPSTSYISNTENTTGLQGCLLISNGWNKIWEIYEEPQKTYTFMEVVKGLKEGKRFRRKDWNNSASFYMVSGELYAYDKDKYIKFGLQEYEADDWIEVQE